MATGAKEGEGALKSLCLKERWGEEIKKYTPPLTYLMDNPLKNINILSDQGLILENYVCKQ